MTEIRNIRFFIGLRNGIVLALLIWLAIFYLPQVLMVISDWLFAVFLGHERTLILLIGAGLGIIVGGICMWTLDEYRYSQGGK